MSNPGLNRLLRTGGLTNFHVSRDGASAVAARGNPHTMFSGERYVGRFSAKTEDKSYNSAHNFEKKENREKGGKGEKRKKDDDSDSDSDDGGDGPHFKSDGIHKKGSDADGDGKKNEGKNKKKPSFADKDKNGKVDAFEKK